jgi:hypothetical protein
MVQIVVTEVTRAAACCPVVLAKSPETGRSALVALFGFQPGEVLVEGAEAGNAAFLPLDLQRQGFFTADDNIAIDLAHPRFAPGGTVPLFDAMGAERRDAPGPARDRPSHGHRRADRAIHRHARGRETDRTGRHFTFFRRRADDRAERLYSVSGEALSALEDATIIRLFRQGWLQAALAIHGSLHQVGILARRRNERLAGGWN